MIEEEEEEELLHQMDIGDWKKEEEEHTMILEEHMM